MRSAHMYYVPYNWCLQIVKLQTCEPKIAFYCNETKIEERERAAKTAEMTTALYLYTYIHFICITKKSFCFYFGVICVNV